MPTKQLQPPKTASETKTALTVAGVVLALNVTPSVIDAYKAWKEHPDVRLSLVLWYVFVAGVCVVGWRALPGGK